MSILWEIKFVCIVIYFFSIRFKFIFGVLVIFSYMFFGMFGLVVGIFKVFIILFGGSESVGLNIDEDGNIKWDIVKVKEI